MVFWIVKIVNMGEMEKFFWNCFGEDIKKGWKNQPLSWSIRDSNSSPLDCQSNALAR